MNLENFAELGAFGGFSRMLVSAVNDSGCTGVCFLKWFSHLTTTPAGIDCRSKVIIEC